VGNPEADLSEAVIDAVDSVILTVDLDGRVVRWNQAAAALTGISSDRIHGQKFQQILLFPDEIDKWDGEFSRISAGNRPTHFETHWKRYDGTPLPLTASCAPVRDDAGNIRHFVCTVTDSNSSEFITDQTAELRNMARFLHDTISQDLIALSYNVSYLETAAIDQSAQAHSRAAADLIDRCCRYIRVMSFMLAPPSPPETTLEASVGQYADFMREEAGLALVAEIDLHPATVRPEVQVLLFAALRKWVAQGIRTRRKPRISVRLRNLGAQTVLEMETLCDASVVPLEPRPKSPYAGWAVIRGRTLALGGEFHIDADSSRVVAAISLPEFPRESPDHERR
jgi:PAS domain S-box-containing protein